MNEAAMKLI